MGTQKEQKDPKAETGKPKRGTRKPQGKTFERRGVEKQK